MTDINLIVGDTDNIRAQVIGGGINVDVTNYDVTFTMENDAGVTYTITCTKGYTDSSTTPQINYSATNGYVTIPFTSRETAKAGTFAGQLHLSTIGLTRGWPVGSYITVKIWEAV
jgi:hypothetical protein